MEVHTLFSDQVIIQQKEYTFEEVRYHDEPNSCWIIVCDKVYDVTNFLKNHPGGEDIVLEYGGRDATFPFFGKGHSKEAMAILSDMCIGILVKHQRLQANKDSDRQKNYLDIKLKGLNYPQEKTKDKRELL